MSKTLPALSLRQPWASLLVHGLKTIEIRSWPTRRRGLVLIHASKLIDERPAGWDALPADARATADRRGGIIGAVHIVDCIAYRSVDAFAADRLRHLNLPDWFREPVLYGFLLREPRLLPFHPVPGWVKFFSVTLPMSVRKAL